MRLTIANIQFHPNGDAVAVLCQHALGSFFVNLKESALEEAAGGANWGNDEVLAAVEKQVAVDHPTVAFEVAFPEKPEPPKVDAPEAEGAGPEAGMLSISAP